MKKIIVFCVSVFFILNGYSQTIDNKKTVNYNIQVQMADSARTFVINYSNGEEFRKLLMLAWGRPVLISAGSIEWTIVSLKDIGNNLKITLTDGIEITQSTGIIYKTFEDDNTKFNFLNNLQINQKRKFTLVFTNQQGANIINTKTIEKAVVNAIDNIASSR